MNTKLAPLSKYVLVDVSAARMARLWTSVSQRLTKQMPLYRRRPILALVAASGLLLGAAAGYFWGIWSGPTRAPRSATVLQTATDRLTVELGRGVTLRLAANSHAQLLPGDDNRISIRLQHGTITCELDSRASRRFSVLVEDLEVRDTGTRFSVSRDSDSGQVDVTVERGSVEIVEVTGPRLTKSISAGEHWTRQRREQPLASALASVAVPQRTESEAPRASAASSSTAASSSHPRDEPSPHSAPPDSVELPSAQALFEQANMARRGGNPSSASEALQTLIARYPNDTRAGLAALELGRLRMDALSDLPGAIRAFQIALARAPSAGFREDALAHLIEAHAALGDTARCHSLCQKYLSEYTNGVHRALVERRCTNR